jgi:Phage terminase large subunit/Terminase RNaseH-like domain
VQLTAKQIEARLLLSGNATNIMLRGGSRSGKTFLLVRAICQRSLNAPGSLHAIWRFRFNHVKASIWQETLPKVMELCFPQIKLSLNHTDLIATFPNKSQIVLGGLDDKARVEKILGKEFATNYYNESSQIPWASVEMGMSRLAQRVRLDPAIAKATGREYLELKAYFDCNPPSKLHWSYELFKAKIKPGTREALANPDDYVEMQMNPDDNRDNLPEKYFEILANMSETKRLRFERGEWGSEVSGALWTPDMIDAQRVATAPSMKRVVIAVDPSGTSGGEGSGDDIGIVAVGLGFDGRGYVLGDWSCNLSPEGWSRKVIEAYDHFGADRIVAERNFGGAMVESTIRTARKTAPVKMVTASRGKVARAEPIAAIYEKGIISHVGVFADLEDQLFAMTPSGFMGDKSPDRADALVWGLTEIMLGGTRYDIDSLL